MSSSGVAAEIHISQRNNKKLVVGDFIYTRERFRKGNTYWICQRRTTCVAKARTMLKGGTLEVETFREHSHAPHPDEVEVLRLRTNLRARAINEPNARALDLVNQEIKKISPAARLAFRDVELLCRVVHRSRACPLQMVATNVTELRIAEHLFKTVSGKQFLLDDNIILNEVDETTQRTIIFATENNIRNLFGSNLWYTDVAFQILSTKFHQLWTIHGKVDETVVPLVYILMQSKREDEYMYVLLRLQQEALQLQCFDQEPAVLMVDFNRGALNALKSVYPNAEIRMRLVHFKQSLFRKLQDFGLKSEHSKEGSAVKTWVRLALGLPYVPAADVIRTFELLRNHLVSGTNPIPDGLHQCLEHLVRNYIQVQQEHEKGTRPLTQRYPIETWNMYDRTLTGEVRTDSAVQQWHNKFEQTANNWKLTADNLVGAIREEQEFTECTLTEIQSGQRNAQQLLSKKTLRTNDLINECVIRYQEYKEASNILEYISTVGSYNVMTREN